MLADNLERQLNELGADGWEVVSLAGIDGAFTLTGNRLYAVLKRPVRRPTRAGETGRADRAAEMVLALPGASDLIAAVVDRGDGAAFQGLCTLVGSRIVSGDVTGELSGMHAALRGTLVAIGVAAGWADDEVRVVVLRETGEGRIGRGTMPATTGGDWRRQFPTLAERFSVEMLDQAWAAAGPDMSSDTEDAFIDLCSRIQAGAPADVAWQRIVGERAT